MRFTDKIMIARSEKNVQFRVEILKYLKEYKIDVERQDIKKI